MKNFPKLYIGAVSKNTIDSVIELSNEKNISLGLIPSRRQVDYHGGYLNWKTEEFSKYVKLKTKNVILERDHGGRKQGNFHDSGVYSYVDDLKHFDLIHIDPFKDALTIDDAIKDTIINLQYLSHLNSEMFFEIGTEEGIRKYNDTTEFTEFISKILGELEQDEISKIKYIVVQGGTKVKSGENIGQTNNENLKKYIEICKEFGISSKEHNGDYLSLIEIKNKFDLGLSAINIAPEFGSIETETLLEDFNISDKNIFFDLVFNSKRWVKWFEADFNPYENIDLVLKMCGHYVFETNEFKLLKNKYPSTDIRIKQNIKSRISEIIEVI